MNTLSLQSDYLKLIDLSDNFIDNLSLIDFANSKNMLSDVKIILGQNKLVKIPDIKGNINNIQILSMAEQKESSLVNLDFNFIIKNVDNNSSFSIEYLDLSKNSIRKFKPSKVFVPLNTHLSIRKINLGDNLLNDTFLCAMDVFFRPQSEIEVDVFPQKDYLKNCSILSQHDYAEWREKKIVLNCKELDLNVVSNFDCRFKLGKQISNSELTFLLISISIVIIVFILFIISLKFHEKKSEL